ncbi:MAG: serine hydrolase [bacterium]
MKILSACKRLIALISKRSLLYLFVLFCFELILFSYIVVKIIYFTPRVRFTQADLAVFETNVINSSGAEYDLVNSDLSTEEDFTSLEQQIIEVIGSETNKYGVYIQDISTGRELKLNSQKSFHPASIYKVPLAMVILKDVDAGRLSLDQQVLVTSNEKIYDFDALSQRSGNYNISLNELLTYLIRDSDNTAMTTLEHRFGGVTLLQKRMREELGFSDVSRLPAHTNADAIGQVFQALYSQNQLSPASSQYLLDLLKTTYFNDRIPAGVPEGIVVAHKIGTLDRTYQDAGIVYGSKHTYILVVLNGDITPQNGREKIAQISSLVYEFLNK